MKKLWILFKVFLQVCLLLLLYFIIPVGILGGVFCLGFFISPFLYFVYFVGIPLVITYFAILEYLDEWRWIRDNIKYDLRQLFYD